MRIEYEPVHFSNLKAFALSPQHYLHALTSGRADNASMRVGRAVHSLALGGAPVLEYPRTRRGKCWERFRAEHPGAEILSSSEYRVAQEAAGSLTRHLDAMEILRGSLLREYSFQWRRNGFLCEGRADFVAPGRYLGDIKVTRSAQPERFGRQALLMAYHAQLSWYAFGLEQNGIQAPEKFLIAIESAPPFPIVIRRLTARATDYGNRLCTLWLEALRGCLESQAWPGYAGAPIDLDAGPDLDDLQFGDESTEEIAA
jgi:hypothetical protein